MQNEKQQKDLDDFLDKLVTTTSSQIVDNMDAIPQNDFPDSENSEDNNSNDEKGLFFLEDDEIENNDIPLEKYLEGNYQIPKKEEKQLNNDNDNNSENDNTDSENSNDNNSENNSEIDNNNNSIANQLNQINYSEDIEEDEDDRKYLDVNDPTLREYNHSSNGITFEDLNKDDDSDDDDGDFDFTPKQNFSDLSNGKKKVFEPGKLNKNNMILAIAGFLMLIIVGFWWATRDKSKLDDKKSSDDNINIDGYNPDFGDYKNRAYHQEDVSDEEQEAVDKINDILMTGEKDKFEPEPAKTTYTSSSNVQSVPQSNGNEEYKNRVESSLRKNLSGQPEQSGLLGNIGSNQGSQNTSYYPMNMQNGQNGYLDGLSEITNQLSQGRNNQSNGNANAGASLRFSDAGKYQRDAKGGDLSSIPPNSVYPGYIIPAVLVSGINTDYPGDITARVTANVYDSRTGSVLLIPSGSILRGSYSSSSIGISRIQIAWQTLIINRDGKDYIVNLGSMVGVDRKGYSGIAGTLNDHYFEYLKAAGLASLFTYINSNIYSVSKAQKNRTTAQMIDDSQEIGNKLADKLLDRALDIAPTVTVKGGTRINVDVNKVLTLIPYERDMPTKRYKR